MLVSFLFKVLLGGSYSFCAVGQRNSGLWLRRVGNCYPAEHYHNGPFTADGTHELTYALSNIIN